MKHFALGSGICAILMSAQFASAIPLTTGLADWCLNINGNINVCNGGSGVAPADVTANLGAFDTTLEFDDVNGLGTITITLAGAGSGQYVEFYSDYDLDYVANGPADDYGGVLGALPADWSYWLDDPETSNIWQTGGPPLPNQNNVSTPDVAPSQCCDVAWALAVQNINVPVGGNAVVTFNVGRFGPDGGFGLRQTNQDVQDSIYLTGSLQVNSPVSTDTPEPATFVTGLLATAGAFFLRRRLKDRIEN